MKPPSLKHVALLAGLFAGGTAALSAATGEIEQSLKIIQTVDPKVNLDFRAEVPSTGEASIVILVDADGKLADWLVARYTHEVYASAALEAVRAWRYEPARAGGRPIGVRTTLTFNFEARGRVVTTIGVELITSFFGTLPQPTAVNRVASPEELDEPLTVVATVEPRFPAALAGPATRAASVVLDFYVDDRGRPRMPVVVSMPHPLFGDAAVAALEQWQFTPPTRRGRPVIVRASQEFVFTSISGGT